jgi:hypothetical protein
MESNYPSFITLFHIHQRITLTRIALSLFIYFFLFFLFYFNNLIVDFEGKQSKREKRKELDVFFSFILIFEQKTKYE